MGPQRRHLIEGQAWLSTAAILLCLTAFFALNFRANSVTLPPNFVEQTIGGNWTDVNGLTFAADGRMFVWERGGAVWLIENNVKLSRPLIDLSEEVGAWNSHGLFAFALDPDFLNNGHIYLMYVVDHHHAVYYGTSSYDPTANEYRRATIGRITRYTARASDNFHSVDPNSRRVLVGEAITNGFPVVDTGHSVGSLIFGEDGTLLASFGDSSDSASTDIGSNSSSFYQQAVAEGIIKPKENVGSFRAQLLSSLNGKVLRIDPATGDGVSSNPFYDAGNPRSAQSRVWALGVRNPFRMTLRPGSGSHDRFEGRPGVLYIGDVGAEDWDDINVCTQGGMNFGWPLFEGLDPLSRFVQLAIANQDAVNPLYGTAGCTRQYFNFRDLIKQATPNGIASGPWLNPCNTSQPIPGTIPVFLHARPAITWRSVARVGIFQGTNAAGIDLGKTGCPVAGQSFSGASTIGGVWYTGSDFPATYRNTYFQADHVGGWIKSFVFDDNNTLLAVRDFAADDPNIVYLTTHPIGGGLYYVIWPSEVRRILYAPSQNRPPLAVATLDKNYGPTPLTVRFTGANSVDPEGLSLSYQWDFGDGSALSSQPNPVHVFDAPPGVPTRFDVTLRVTDSSGAPAEAKRIVSVNNTPPVVTITSPTNGTLYPRANRTTYPCTAEVSDTEHGADELSCVWQTALHHNTHTHPEPPDTNCATTTVVSPAQCEGQTYFYAVTLTVTDRAGLATTNEVTLLQNCDLLVPEITWPTPADIAYGTALSSGQLDATANTAGTFAYNPRSGAILPVGVSPLGLQFAPADTFNYTDATARVSINVLPASLRVTANDQTNVFGTLLPALTARYSGFVNGEGPANLDTPVLLSTTATTGSPTGLYPIIASGAADASYGIAYVDGTLTVIQATSVLTWTNPARIVYGTPLSDVQLNATANVPGIFAYDPPAGTVLGPGLNQRLSAVFTPDDTNYATTAASATVHVIAPPLAPTNLRAVASGRGQIQLGWTDNAINEDGFKIEHGTNGTDFVQIGLVGQNVTNAFDSGVFGGMTNFYRVRAYNAAGDSPYSEIAQAFVLGVLDPNAPPGRNFDLSHWYLTLPASNLTTIDYSELVAGYTSAWFYTGADGAMVFWCPVTGATTSGSSFPRSELREEIVPGNTDINWSPYGRHILDAQCKVTQLPSTGKVIIGQIHSKTGPARPLIKLLYNSGTLEMQVKNSPNADADTTYTGPKVALNNLITYQIKLVDGLLSITLNGSVRAVNVFASDPNWADQRFYFKAGSYSQDNSGTVTEGARVAFYELNVTHVDVSELPPTILRQPASQSIPPGGTASFNVAATGAPPLSYNWLFNGTNLSNGNGVTGVTTTNLTLASVQPNNAGKYSVVVSNAVAQTTSSNAVLTVLTTTTLNLGQALDAPALTWKTGGNLPWIPQNGVTHDGIAAAQSGNIGNSQESWIETTVTGPGTLSFWWQVSSEPGKDRLRFYTNGTQALEISGEIPWQWVAINFGAGTQVLRWRYVKNSSTVQGQDRAWLDQIAFGQFPPIITSQPANQTIDAGTTATFNVVAAGTPPLAYQWQWNGLNLTNGGNISGATAARLTISAAQLTNAGPYMVQIRNSTGNVASVEAQLTVTPILTLDEALDRDAVLPGGSAPGAWRGSGTLPWIGQTQVTYDGVDAGRSGAILHGQDSRCETTITGPGTLAFWWKVSCETNNDRLRLYTNGTEALRISGEVDWQPRTINLAAGQQTIRFHFDKNSSLSLGQDRAWLDEVQFLGGTPPPPDTNAPSAVTNLLVTTVTSNSATLQWTAPARSAAVSSSTSRYDLRFSAALITEANWNSASQANGEPAPALPGTSQTFTVSNALAPNTTYYFALKTTDDAGNTSPLSNVAQTNTGSAGVPPAPNGPTNTLVAVGAIWKYVDDGSDLGDTWRAPGFSDTGWKAGPSPLGYDAHETTTVSYGTNASLKYVSTYFRHTFAVDDPAVFSGLILQLVRDDGAVVYLNGNEVFRGNMPTGSITYLTLASGSGDTSTWFPANFPISGLLTGPNLLAVEIHQKSRTSSDIAFNLELKAVRPP